MAGTGKKSARIPAERTAFFGRDADLGRLAAWHAGGAPLATLIGPGGIGKTRLARRFCRAHEPSGDVLFCDLTEARDADGVVVAVARALDVPVLSGPATRAQIGVALAARGAPLCVLDNFEQLVAVARGTVAAWLDEAPDARFLVTSREPLGIEGEVRVEIGPLADGDGEALLEDRARAARGGRALDEGDRAAAREIVRRLDGLPLALELAAARAELLSLAEIRDRLDRRFDLLRLDGARAEGRHGTLIAALGWSWDLLTAPEQAALAQCAVFHGGFSVDAAEAVIDPGPSAPPVLDLVQALRRKSLIHVIEGSTQARLGLLESIRALATAKLDDEARVPAEARHATFHARVAAELAEAARGPEAASAIAQLGELADNLFAAHARSLAGAPEAAAQLAIALDVLLAARGPGSPRRALLDAAVDAADRAGDAGLVARALLRRGHEALAREDAASARADFEASSRRAHDSGAHDTAALARLGLALLHLRRFDRDEAFAHGEAALGLARASKDRAIEGEALSLLGETCRMFQQRADAERHLEASIALLREVGAVHLVGEAVQRLGVLHGQAGRLPAARACFERAHALQAESGSRVGEPMLLRNLGRLSNELGDHAAARAWFERALAGARELGDRWSEVGVLHGFGLFLQDLGQLDEAMAMFRAARARVAHGTFPRRLGDVLLDLGCTQVLAGEVDEGETTLREAKRVAESASDREVLGVTLSVLAALLAARGSVADAERGFDEARAVLASDLDHASRPALDLLEATLDLACAAQAEAQGDTHTARRFTESAARRRAVPTTSATLRTAAGIVDRLAPAPASRSAARIEPQAPPRASPAVEIEATGRWFRVPGAMRTTLARRPSLHRLLGALLARHREASGESLSWPALLEVGWPGERVLREAGRNRVQVAIRTLRREGLEDVLLTGGEGYLLDPAIEIVVR